VNISEKGLALIKHSEGYSAHVYTDVDSPAIGYGHRLQPGESFPDGITESEASTLLQKDLSERFEPSVRELVPAECNQGQYDALCSFAYNLGIGALKTVLSHGFYQFPIQAPRWCHVDGKESPGLLARRNEEVKLWESV
jgi:lysozyme